MRLNFKKVSAIAASALMVGMTMGVAAAATTYPAPFVSGTGADVAIVYGTGSGVSSLDQVQGYNINLDLQSRMTSSTGTTTSVTGGDSKILSTSARKLYYGDAINSAYSSLGSNELGSVLADGTFTDLSGTAYGYIQTVKIGTAPITFGTSSGDLKDPALYIDAGTTATAVANLYNYTLSFTKNVNVSDGVNVQGQKINILGVDYVIGTSSTNSTLYLYGSGETMTVSGAESKTVNIAGTDHVIKLVTTADATHATISVDGVSKSVVEGSNYAFSGDINVYIKDVIHPAYAGDIRQAELIVGASTLKLVNGATVKKGADLTSIQGTSVMISAAGDGIISGFTVAIAAQKSKNDSIEVGQEFMDPVFGGLKLTLAAANPAIDSTSRGKIVVRTDDTSSAYVTFTSALAGTTGEKELQYSYDNDTTATAISPLLAGSQTINGANARGKIHVLEGELAKQGDWIVVNQGDAGKILYVEDISINTELTGTVTFSDAITGESIPVTVNNVTGTTSGYTMTGNMFGGTGYTVTANATYVNVTWDAAGVYTLFPRIKLANGGWMAFLTDTNITNGTTLILPNGITTLETAGQLYQNISGDIVANDTYDNGIGWLQQNASATMLHIWGINNTNSGGTRTVCNFNASRGPAILYLEPKKWDDSTNGDIVCIPMGSGTTEITIGDPVFNGTNSGYLSLQSDTYVKKAVDKYGTLVTKEDRTNSNGIATLSYPSSQMYFDVVFSAVAASISGGTAGSVGGQIGNVVVKDTEVSSVSSKNLIVVGGSCINSVAANLLGGMACGSDFTTNTGIGSGQFLIQSVASTYSSSKVALIVAGYEADDTVNAATYLMNKGVETTAGKKYKGTSATAAELVVA
jgi:hypothetical protein